MAAESESKNPENKQTRSLFTSNTKNTGSSSPKRRRSSKLKQRRLKSKLESKKLKNEQVRNRKVEKQKNMISTNEMYPECKPLSKEEIELIKDTIINSKLNELEESPNLGKEFDDGYIEFKWKLICPEPERIQHLMTQQKYRLNEGNGKCIYQIGIEDCGNPKGLNDQELIETIKTIFRLNKQLNGKIEITSIKKGQHGKVATLTIFNKQVVINKENDASKEEQIDLSGIINNNDQDTNESKEDK